MHQARLSHPALGNEEQAPTFPEPLHEEFEVAMQLVADGRIRTDPLHTDTVGLAGIQSAFDALLAGGKQVKVLVDPRL